MVRRSYAILIIALMIGGIGVSATYAALLLHVLGPPFCGTPPTGGTPIILPASGGSTIINGKTFVQQNITFTAAGQQVIIGAKNQTVDWTVNFQTLEFFDPNFPHLVGNQCLPEPNLPYTVVFQIIFADGSIQTMKIEYGGNPPAAPVFQMTSHANPQAGIRTAQDTRQLTLFAEYPLHGSFAGE